MVLLETTVLTVTSELIITLSVKVECLTGSLHLGQMFDLKRKKNIDPVDYNQVESALEPVLV
jgi:hypothetical protein